MAENLVNIKEQIERLSFFHQIEILRILNADNSDLINENNNGVFINMTQLDNSTIENLTKYLNYVSNQENHITIIEDKKKKLVDQYFNSSNPSKLFNHVNT